jgi:RNA polymerase sigma factor (sigma-70 family)
MTDTDLHCVSAADAAAWVLRDHQVGVVEAAVTYIEGMGRDKSAPAFGRIVLPPRTGKTEIAASVIDKTGIGAVFMAPRKFLVDQAADLFRRRLPNVPVWKLYGGSREVGDRGIVVATYDTLEELHKSESMPALARNARLVFIDEAHHAMTDKKQAVLRNSFREDAVRIALTATPDYDEERVLARYFPDLIHEMTIQEGVQMNLLAPVRCSAFEVDAGGSQVRIINGDYDPRDLEIVMSRRPMLQALEEFRYTSEFCNTPALICCRTKQQAITVFEFLAERSSDTRPVPGLVLGDLDDESRQNILGLFESGAIDTLITVGVLIEGWSSERCKLLIDLAPGLSVVRACQKYTRPMTKVGDTEARIVVLIPDGLREFPVLPLDVFGPGIEEALGEAPVSRPRPRLDTLPREESPWERLRTCGIRVSSVNVKLRLIEETLLHRVNVRREQTVVHKLVRKHFGAEPVLSLPTYARFLRTRFVVEGIAIAGRQLLRFLGFLTNADGFRRFMTKYYPKAVADGILTSRGFDGASDRLTSSRQRLLKAMRDVGAEIPEELPATPGHYADNAWLAKIEEPAGLLMDVGAASRWPMDVDSSYTRSAYEHLEHADRSRNIARLLDMLTPIEREMLSLRYGLGEDAPDEDLTLTQIGERYHLSRERARQICEQARDKMRRWFPE